MIGPDGRETYRGVWPRGAKAVQATDVAPRLSTLDGKTIGQLWDDLFRGDEIFPILEEEIARRFPGVRFVRYDTLRSTPSSRGWPAEGAARPPCCGPVQWRSERACRARPSSVKASEARPRPPPRAWASPGCPPRWCPDTSTSRARTSSGRTWRR